MATGPAFEDAVRLAKETPLLSVGCHVVLIDGAPVLDVARLPTITSRNSRPARFGNSLKSFAAQALTRRLDPAEIEAETTAQIRKIQSAGISVSHIDSHKHTHLFAAVLRPVLRAALACGVQAVRNPFGPRKPLKSSELLARPSLWVRYAEVRLLRTLSGKFRDAARRQGMVTPDGTWEFVCHPGYNDADLQQANTRLSDSRETELRLLTMPEAKRLLEDQGIALISYRELISTEAGR